MHEWPIDRDLDERLRDLVFAEVAAAEPREITFRSPTARRGSLAGTGIAASAAIVLIAALVWRSQLGPVNGGPSVSPTQTQTTLPSSSPSAPTATFSAVPSIPATGVKTPACWADGQPVVLADGRLLYAQGNSCNLIFDPATQTFTSVGQMNEDRQGATATLLKDGRVLIAGGMDMSTGSDLVKDELFDPKTGRFTPIVPDRAPASTAVSLLLPDGRVLLLGGVPYDATLSQLAAEIYDPANGTFTAAGLMTLPPGLDGIVPPPVSGALLGNGKVLVVAADPDNLTRTEIYDPSTGTFTPTAGSAVVRGNGSVETARLPDGRIMICGAGSTVVEAYDPATDAFTRLASLPQADVRAATTLTDGRVLAIAAVDYGEGLRSGSPGSQGVLYDRRPLASSGRVTIGATVSLILGAEIYDPAANKWTDLGRLTEERMQVQIAPLPGGGAIVSGSIPGGGAGEVVELFDPKTNKFIQNL